MIGSTTVVAPCPNIPPGWPCSWALRQAALGRARYLGGGGGETTLRPPGSGLAVLPVAPSRPPRGRRRVSRRSPLFIPCACCPCALWPGLWTWSLPPCGTVPVLSRLPGCRGAPAALWGGGGKPEAPRLADRAVARAVVVPHQASPTRTPSSLSPRRPCGSLRPHVLVPRRHGQWHKSRASRAGTGLVIRCDTGSARHVLAWVPPSARGGDDGAPVCPLRLGQPSALGWSRRARQWRSPGAFVRWATRRPQGAG